MLKNESSKKTVSSYDQRFVWSDNPGQNISNKIEKSSKTGQDKKSLISTFAYFLTANAQVPFAQGALGTSLHQVCLSSYQVLFYFCLIKFVLKHCKVPKYYQKDCLKVFFLLSTLPVMIRISRKNSSFG